MRRLALRRETLAELPGDELSLVNGGSVTVTALTWCDLACTAVGAVERAVTDLGRFPTETCTPTQ